jgi:hypothetical protein
MMPQPTVTANTAAAAATTGTVIPLKAMPAKAVARGPDESKALLSLLETPEGAVPILHPDIYHPFYMSSR